MIYSKYKPHIDMYKKEALTMKKRILQVVLGILLVLLLAIAGFGVLYALSLIHI